MGQGAYFSTVLAWPSECRIKVRSVHVPDMYTVQGAREELYMQNDKKTHTQTRASHAVPIYSLENRRATPDHLRTTSLRTCSTIYRTCHSRTSAASISAAGSICKTQNIKHLEWPGQGVTERFLLPTDDPHRHAHCLLLLCRQVQARALQQALALGEHLSLRSRHNWRRVCNKTTQRGRGLLG